jgi:hypothetical protein
VAPLLKNSLKRQNEKREVGALDGVGRQLIAEKQKLK